MKKKVAIIGMATTSRHLAPWDDDEFEIWGLNESYWGGHVGPDKTPYMKGWDRGFQMHPEWDYNRAHNFNHPLHPQWLRNDPWTEEELAATEKDKIYKEFLSGGATREQRRQTDFPIYLLGADSEIPGSEVYPMQEILDAFGDNSEVVRWFTNSFAFMVALAIHLEFEEMHYYGFEMSSQEEYGHQRACAVFWNGIAVGRGIKVVEPSGCKLMGQDDVLYGYDKIPGITKMHLEIERNMYAKEVNKVSVELERIRGEKNRASRELGAAIKSKQVGRINRLKKDIKDLMNREVESAIMLNAQNAARQVTEKHIRDLDGLPNPETIKLVPLGGKIQIS